MKVLHIILTVIQVLCSVSLVAIVMMQSGNEDGLSAITGSSESFMSRNKNSSRDAKLAKLNYRQIGKTDRYWLVEVELLTGRHHQIRCQLSNMGCPIKGDLKYGAPRSNPDGGISLHARRITFMHPVKKEEMTVEAPVPSSWKGVPGC